MAGAKIVPSPIIKHFSHPHELELSSFQYQQGLTSPSTLCSCCERTPSGKIYICKPCNFILHLNCSQFPQLISHGGHSNHTLTLLQISPYSTGKFGCDACGSPGNRFSYHCSSCSYDLHPLCAFKPPKFIHQFHACPLALIFKDPYTPKNCFSCDICEKPIGSNEWRYRCGKCDFDVHLGCAKASPARGVVQGGQSPAPHNQYPFRPPGSSTSDIPYRMMNAMAQGFIQGFGGQVGHTLGGSYNGDDHNDHHHRTVDQGDSNWDVNHTGGFIGANHYQGTVDQGDSNWDGNHTGGFIGDNHYQGTVDSDWDGDNIGGFSGNCDTNWDGDDIGGFMDDFSDF